jgi:hypothetical protein
MQDEKETILRARNVKVECKFADDTKTEFCSRVTTGFRQSLFVRLIARCIVKTVLFLYRILSYWYIV